MLDRITAIGGLSIYMLVLLSITHVLQGVSTLALAAPDWSSLLWRGGSTASETGIVDHWLAVQCQHSRHTLAMTSDGCSKLYGTTRLCSLRRHYEVDMGVPHSICYQVCCNCHHAACFGIFAESAVSTAVLHPNCIPHHVCMACACCFA
jgi:hypothetical protein